jgi:Domain of unknown function (DUF4386)
VLFPVLRLQNEVLAVGYVAARILECVFIAVGILAVLTVVTLAQERGADAGTTAYSLAALKDWTFIKRDPAQTSMSTFSASRSFIAR